MSQPTMVPDVGAEILYREINLKVIDNQTSRPDISGLRLDKAITVFGNYLKIKVFDARGAQGMSRYDIDIRDEDAIDELYARVTRPDGSVLNLSGDDLIDREFTQEEGKGTRRCSLAFPGLVPGSIVEIRWEIKSRGVYGHFFWLSHRLPTHTVRLVASPYSKLPFIFNYHNALPLENTDHGVWTVELQNLPGIPDEPFRPAESSLASWISLTYSSYVEDFEDQESWKSIGEMIWRRVRFDVRIDDGAIARKAAQLTAGVDDPVEKLRRLYDYCSRQLVRERSQTDYGSLFFRNVKRDFNVAEVLSSGKGDMDEITMLFGAMAHSCGFEVNLAMCNDRTELDWDINHALIAMVPDIYVAIRNGEKWDFYKPGDGNLPFGSMVYGNEGTVAVLGSDGDEAEMVVTPTTPPEASRIVRTGTLAVDEEGTLRGNVTFEYSGHCAFRARRDYAGYSTDARLYAFLDDFDDLMPNAVVSSVVFENLGDLTKNVIIRFTIEDSGYAEISDDRIIVQPAVFQRGVSPIFTQDTRITDIRFPYEWEECDKIKISYPESFEYEGGSVPQGVVNTPQLAHVVQLGLSRRSPTLIYNRSMKIGVLSLPLRVYADIKNIFDAIHQEDQYYASFRRKPEAPEGAAGE